jgi:hypothetical protein
MKYWIFTIVLALLFAGQANAENQLRLPPIFDGMSITPSDILITPMPVLMKTIPGGNAWAKSLPEGESLVLVGLKITVPPQAPSGTSPMDGYRQDMWSSDQPQLFSITKLTGEQSYKVYFCLLNKKDLGFACNQSTSEIMAAPRHKPWWIPVLILPQRDVAGLTALLTSGPIPASVTRVAGMNVQPQQSMTDPGILIPWSD